MSNPASLRAVTINGEVQIPTRPEIREYVAHHVGAVRAFAESGGNPHHMLFDHQDQVERFAAALAEPQREQFMRIYTEETAAALETVKAAVAQKEAREIGRAQGMSGVVWLVLIVVTLVAVPMLLRSC
jgi:hypothetical protein